MQIFIDEERANATCRSEGCTNKVKPPVIRKGKTGPWVNYMTRCYGCQHNMCRYKITVPARDSLLKGQKGKCAICKERISFEAGTANVDHSHKTGVVRGVLCSLCNQGIGLLKEKLKNFHNAIKYLKLT
jgi:Recombination endonuclease VII